MHFQSFMGQILRVVAQKVDNMITIIFISVGKKKNQFEIYSLVDDNWCPQYFEWQIDNMPL